MSYLSRFLTHQWYGEFLFMENYTSDSSDSDSSTKTLDLSYLMLDTQLLNDHFTNTKNPENVDTLLLHQNRLNNIPQMIVRFTNLNSLDISNCGLHRLPDFLGDCPLTCLVAKHNNLTNDSLPKNFQNLSRLRELNLSGNRLTNFPMQILDLTEIKYLYLGGNQITEISKDVWKLQRYIFFSSSFSIYDSLIKLIKHFRFYKVFFACAKKDNHKISNVKLTYTHRVFKKYFHHLIYLLSFIRVIGRIENDKKMNNFI